MPRASSVKTRRTAVKNRKAKKYVCGVCGLTVSVDACGNSDTGGLICCDKVMRPRK